MPAKVKPPRPLRAAAVLALALALAAPAARGAEVVERILAVVNDEIITEEDIHVVLAPVAAQYRTAYAGQELEDRLTAARKNFLQKTIEDKLILSEAKRRQVIVNDEEVNEMVGEIRAKFPDKETFVRALDEQGLTENKLWARFRDQLMMQKLVGYEVKAKISVSPGEVNEYYRTHPEDFAQADQADLRHILIRTASRSQEEAMALADRLAAQLRSGASFEDLARQYSEGAEAKEGGRMGWMEKGQLMGEIDTQVFAAAPGDLVGPIRTSLGYHLFKVVERKQFSTKPLAEVRDQVQESLFKQKMRQRLQAWTAGLRKDAYISIR